MKANAYLDAVKAELNITSDYELSKRLEVGNGHVAEWRTGKRGIPVSAAFKIAITLHLDPAEVVADLEEQREKNPKRRDFWRGFLRRAGQATVATLCTLAVIFSATFGSVQVKAGGSLFRFPKNA